MFRESQQARNSLSARVAIGSAFILHKREPVEKGNHHFVKSFVKEHFSCAYTVSVGQRVRQCGKLVESGKAVFRGERAQARAQPIPSAGPPRAPVSLRMDIPFLGWARRGRKGVVMLLCEILY